MIYVSIDYSIDDSINISRYDSIDGSIDDSIDYSQDGSNVDFYDQFNYENLKFFFI